MNILIQLSPCSAPWMVANGDGCMIANGVMLLEALAAALILGGCGLVGLLGAVSTRFDRNPPLGVSSVICLVGCFLELLNAWLYS